MGSGDHTYVDASGVDLGEGGEGREKGRVGALRDVARYAALDRLGGQLEGGRRVRVDGAQEHRGEERLVRPVCARQDQEAVR